QRMEAVLPSARPLPTRPALPDEVARRLVSAVAAVAVVLLALKGGVYDEVLRGQVGLLLWWAVLLGALVGLVPGRLSAAAWVALGLLVAFTAWIALSIAWSESPTRSAAEL